MIMIHQRLCHNSLLRAEHVMPGRLLRVRLPLPGKDLRHLQIICAYQKAWNSQQASSVVEQRSRFWNKLDTALASVPNRDVVILGGDLNVSIPAVTGTSGSGVSPSPKDGAPDVYDLIGIAKQHGLIFLNTWNGRGTPVHTFQFGKYRAQLDFVLCRVLQADGVARQAGPWHRFQLSQGSESGAVHYPVHASIPVRKAEWHMHGPKSTSAFDKEAIIQAACNLPDQEAASVIQLRQLVQQGLQSVCHTSQLMQLPHIVSRACMQIFPARRGRQITEALWQNAGIVASVSNTWRLWRSMKAMAGRSLTSMFKKWSLLTQHLKARKQQRRLSRQARRQKLLGFVGQAVEAASRHDVRRLYEVVNKLSKPKHKRVALRGQHNELLSAVEEADLLADHFAQRFQATHEQDIALRQASWVTSGNIQIDDFALRLSCCKYKSLFSTENFRIFMMRKFRLSVLGKLYKSWERIFLVAIRATELFCSGQGAMAEAPNLEGILAPLLLRVARLEAHVTTMDLPFVEDRLDNMETVVAALGREFDALAQRLEELQRQIRRLEAAVCSLERERRSINDLADRISNLEIASGQETQRALEYHQIVLQELDHRVASLESPAHPDNP